MSEVVNKEQQEVVERALTIPQQAQMIQVVDNDSYARAGEILLVVKDLRKEIGKVFDPIIEKAHAAHKEAVSQKKKAEEPLVKAEMIIKPRLAAYNTEQERLRKEAEAKLQADLKKQEEDRKLEDAVAAEASGDREAAERILEEPTLSPVVVIPKTVPKVTGISFQKRWTYRIVDESKIPHEYLQVNEVKIGQVVRAMKDLTNIPGIEVYSEDIAAAGRR